MRSEEPVEIPKEKIENSKENEEEEDEEGDDFALLGYPKKNYEKVVYFLPVLAVLLSIASFFIKVIPDHSCPPHLNDLEYHKTVRYMSRLQQTFHRGESYEEVFDDLAIILNEFSNEDFKKAFLENSWNNSYVKTLVKIAKMNSYVCKKSESISLLLYTLQTIKQIFVFGATRNNERLCLKAVEHPSEFLDIAQGCKNNAFVLTTIFETMDASLNLSCANDTYTKLIPKIASFAEKGKFEDVEKSIIAFFADYVFKASNPYSSKENVDAICNVVNDAVVSAKIANANDAERLCFLIRDLNCTGIPRMAYGRLFSSEACYKYR